MAWLLQPESKCCMSPTRARHLPSRISWGGHISSAFASVGGLGQYPDKVELLAITGPHRLKNFPDVPTFQQLGYPLHGLTGWAGVFAPQRHRCLSSISSRPR